METGIGETVARLGALALSGGGGLAAVHLLAHGARRLYQRGPRERRRPRRSAVQLAFARLSPPGYWVFHEFDLVGADGLSALWIDHLVASPYGVFVIARGSRIDPTPPLPGASALRVQRTQPRLERAFPSCRVALCALLDLPREAVLELDPDASPEETLETILGTRTRQLSASQLAAVLHTLGRQKQHADQISALQRTVLTRRLHAEA
ncbi:MAG: nuclease-related domain-containing protein [Verrucomicrobiota bacterium]